MPKKHEILWTRPALDDLRGIREYVSRDKPMAAAKLAQTIRKSVLRLATQPRSGRIVPELSERGYREVIVSPYRIVYEVQDGRVLIVRVWHSRRQLTDG